MVVGRTLLIADDLVGKFYRFLFLMLSPHLFIVLSPAIVFVIYFAIKKRLPIGTHDQFQPGTRDSLMLKASPNKFQENVVALTLYVTKCSQV
jgi:Na+/H+ antiporter NhaD/arsenite permease-like protein